VATKRLTPISPSGQYDTALHHGVNFVCTTCREGQFFPIPHTWVIAYTVIAYTAAMVADWLEIPIHGCVFCVLRGELDDAIEAMDPQPGWNECGLPDFF